jgi:hypothetical protein
MIRRITIQLINRENNEVWTISNEELERGLR